MATATAGSRKRTPTSSGFVFHDVSWDDYEAMLRIVGERPIRVIYDQGQMEIFMPIVRARQRCLSPRSHGGHADRRTRCRRRGRRTTTHKRQDLGKGAEPDECYWFGDNARHMRGKRQLDLNRDPAPDLIIEVDVTRTSLDRLKIFAAMGVPEVWRSTGRSLQFLHLQADGTYQPRTTSRSFPTLPVSSVAQFLKEVADRRHRPTWIRSFRAFVREKVVPGQRPNGRSMSVTRPAHDRKASASVGSGVRSGRNGARSSRGGRPSTRSATSSAVAGASCKPARLCPVATIRFATPGAVPM